MTTYHRFDGSMDQLKQQLELRKDSTPKAMLYNISIFNSFNNEPTTLIIEFIDQDEISSVINVKDVEAGMSERGVLNLDLNLTVDSEMKYGLELRTAEYTSLIEEQLLSAECSIVGKRMNAVDGEKASYAADKVTFEHSIPCGFDTIQRINTNAIRLQLLNQDWSQQNTLPKYNGNGLPFYLFEDAFLLIKFQDPISNKIIQINPIRIDKVTEKLDERVEFDIDACSLFSTQQNNYIQNSVNWGPKLLDCMEKVEDKDGIMYVGISLEIDGVDAAILCPPENLSKEWEYEDWLNTNAREKNDCKINQKQ